MKLIKIYREHFICRLALFVFFILLFLLGLCLFISRSTTRSIRQNTLDMNEKLLAQAQNGILEYLDTLSNITTVFSYSPTTLSYLAGDSYSRLPDSDDLSEVFSNILLLDGNILNVTLYNTQLQRITAMGKDIPLPIHSHTMPETPEILPHPLYDGAGHLYYEYLLPVYDLDAPQFKKELGLCVFLLEPDGLADTLPGSKATEHTNVLLLDSSDNILSREGPVHFGSSLPPERQKSDPEHYYCSLLLSVNGWRLVSLLPEDELNDSGALLAYMPYLACLLSLVSFGILVFYYYYSINCPIWQTVRFIRSVNANPKNRLYLNRVDEVGIIANSLNQMLDDAEAMQAELHRSETQIYEAKLAQKQMEILAYRNQINPHFLYNTFECIRGMALNCDADDIAEITLALSNVFRFAVKGSDVVSVADEVAYMLEYAKIIEYRFMGKISIDVAAEPSVRNKKVFRMLLQPLVENAVFHGLEQKIGEGLVDVEISAPKPGFLRFTVEDDGCGMSPEQKNAILDALDSRENTSRVGLFNIYRRLKLFYSDRFTFRLDSTPGKGTRVTIQIPGDPGTALRK